MPVTTAIRADHTRRRVAQLCTEATSPQELLEGVAATVRPLVRQEAAAWLVTDPVTMLFTDGVIEGFSPETCEPWYHHELSVPNVATFAQLASGRPAVTVLSEATRGDVASSPRWREVLAPSGYGRELRVVFRDHGVTWGCATVHRNSKEPDFGRADADLFGALSPLVGAGLRRLVVEERTTEADLDGPGLLLVGPDRVARAGTPAGARWLELLGAPTGELRHTWLLSLGELATRGSGTGKRIRLRARDGRWATLHAEPLQDRDGTFAVIVEPSRPTDVAAVIAMAYGLSPREQDLVLALARGEGTQAIADRLRISPHTVRDHIKSIFDKTGVSSRNELVAKLFHDHYAEHFFSRVSARHGPS